MKNPAAVKRMEHGAKVNGDVQKSDVHDEHLQSDDQESTNYCSGWQCSK